MDLSSDVIQSTGIDRIQKRVDRLTIMQLSLHAYRANTNLNLSMNLDKVPLSPDDTHHFNKAVHARLYKLLSKLMEIGLVHNKEDRSMPKQVARAMCMLDREVRLVQKNPFLSFSNLKALGCEYKRIVRKSEQYRQNNFT